MNEPLIRAPALRWNQGSLTAREDVLAVECAIAMSYNDRVHAVMLATPHDLADFALGFALAEGVIESAQEFELVDCSRTSSGLCLDARIPQHRFDALQARPFMGNSACGLCGSSALAHWTRPPPTVRDDRRWPVTAITAALAQLEHWQPLNQACGGLHAAAWVEPRGIALSREDVGRHNALDKLLGALQCAQLEDCGEHASGTTHAAYRRPRGEQPGFVLLSSRASFELVHKCARAGVGLLVTVSAPSSAAVELARSCNLSLIAFARGQTLTIYSGEQRVIFNPSE